MDQGLASGGFNDKDRWRTTLERRVYDVGCEIFSTLLYREVLARLWKTRFGGGRKLLQFQRAKDGEIVKA